MASIMTSSSAAVLQGDRVRSPRGSGLHQLLFSRFGGALGLVALVVSVLLPAEGLGFDMCWLNATFGLPCPGCGLTRSVTNISHFHWMAAWQYNPFGFPTHAVFVLMTVCGLAPSSVMGRWERGTRRYTKHLYWITMLILVGLVIFGAIRLVLYYIAGASFPQPL